MAMFIKSRRDKNMIIINKYKYNFASKNVITYDIRWKCVKRTCLATLYTSHSKVANFNQFWHNHNSCSDTEINRHMFYSHLLIMLNFTVQFTLSNDFSMSTKAINICLSFLILFWIIFTANIVSFVSILFLNSNCSSVSDFFILASIH